MQRIHLNKVAAVAFLALAMVLSSCSRGGAGRALSSIGDNVDHIADPAPNNPDKPSDEKPSDGTDDNSNGYQRIALSWETSSKPERAKWSEYLHNIILNKWNTLLQGADDMDIFCPRFDSLNNDQRANVWAALFSAVSKFESSYNPAMRFHESTMGTDSVTKQPVYSEGLLQLSYQDVRGYPFCEFDWEVDRKLKPTDSRKTIFDPYKNLDCGVGIMTRQLARSGLITVKTNAYWSTLKSGGKYNRITQIASIVKKLPFCQK
ncbi:hypothetical protein [Bdellovibrio sp. HCB2-146]|uniref:hypothetical protein n=1 Tax=Bdellovibrio sp. HCB2-146 TaxID=3394362 RepID=UPI0039BCA5F6